MQAHRIVLDYVFLDYAFYFTLLIIVKITIICRIQSDSMHTQGISEKTDNM